MQQAGAEQQRLGREIALTLLMRSIAFQHRRLAVLRLCHAAQLGAAVPVEAWNYCRHVAAASDDARLQTMFIDAATHASAGAACAATATR